MSWCLTEFPRVIFGGGSCPQYGADIVTAVLGAVELSSLSAIGGTATSKDLADDIEAQTEAVNFIPEDLKPVVENKQLVSCSSSSSNVSFDLPNNYAPTRLTSHSQGKN